MTRTTTPGPPLCVVGCAPRTEWGSWCRPARRRSNEVLSAAASLRIGFSAALRADSSLLVGLPSIRREASAEDSIRPAGSAENGLFRLPTSLTSRVDRQPPIAAVAQQHERIRQEPDAISLEQRELRPSGVHQLRPDAAI